ncbi:MAG: hypothetical protein WBH44_01210 [Proteocatella sp.]
MINIYFSKLKENAVIPMKREEDAGYDIYPCFADDYLLINPAETVKIPAGIASCFPKEYCFIIKERGSTGSIGLGQRSGVIDSGYRNEWLLPVTNHSSKPIMILKDEFRSTKAYEELTRIQDIIEYDYKKAIAQALLIPVPQTQSIEISYEELLEFKSDRMFDGFGSTNKK